MTSQPKTCEVWPEHWRALELLSACQSQWQLQVAGMGGIVWRGAQWVNVAQAMRFMGVPHKEQGELWQQYRVMEAEALGILQQRADEQASKK